MLGLSRPEGWFLYVLLYLVTELQRQLVTEDCWDLRTTKLNTHFEEKETDTESQKIVL